MHIDPRLDELPLSRELEELCETGTSQGHEAPQPPPRSHRTSIADDQEEDRPTHRTLRILRVLMDE